jgi:hypothetical protein
MSSSAQHSADRIICKSLTSSLLQDQILLQAQGHVNGWHSADRTICRSLTSSPLQDHILLQAQAHVMGRIVQTKQYDIFTIQDRILLQAQVQNK